MTPFSTTDLLAAAEKALAGRRATDDRPSGGFAICITDDGGHVLLHLRQPSATVAAADSALSKARTAVWLGADTGGVPAGAPVIAALTAGVPWPVNVFPGGRVLRHGGTVVGGVGVGGSNDPADDAAVADAAHAVLSAR
jgi:uncharacterized protein GlcG (DUF336 family)